MSKPAQVRILVTDVDQLLLLTEAQLKVWLYYRRRYGVDGRAWGKSGNIGAATGLVAGTVRNARQWLVKNGWLIANGKSDCGLPMFKPTVPRVSSSSGTRSQMAVIPELQPLSSPNDNSVSSSDVPEVLAFEVAAGEGFRSSSGESKTDSENAAPTSRLAAAALRVGPNPRREGKKEQPQHQPHGGSASKPPLGGLLVPQTPTADISRSATPLPPVAVAPRLGSELCESEHWEEAKKFVEFVYPTEALDYVLYRMDDAVRCFEAYNNQLPDFGCDADALYKVWMYNQLHKTGKLKFRSIAQMRAACESKAENNIITQSWHHRPRDCHECDKRTWEQHRAECSTGEACVCDPCQRHAARNERGSSVAKHKEAGA